jgi:hypothetical protein
MTALRRPGGNTYSRCYKVSDVDTGGMGMATPQIPEGRCPHCNAPIIDLFAEWTEEYQTPEGKRAILAGETVFDCYYCAGPLQLSLPLALVAPAKGSDEYRIAKRQRSRCDAWLRSQHPGESLSQIVENAGWQFQGRCAFDGYNWKEGTAHQHGQDTPPHSSGANP